MLRASFRIRIVVIFVCLTLVSGFLLFVFASEFIATGIEKLFDKKVESVLKDAMEVAESYARAFEAKALHTGMELGQFLMQERLVVPSKPSLLQEVITRKRQELGIDGVQVFTPDLLPMAAAFGPYVPADVVAFLAADQLHMESDGQAVSQRVTLARGEVIRGIVPIWGLERRGMVAVMVVTSYLPSEVGVKLRRGTRIFADYQRLNALRGAMKTGYVVTFLGITLLVICAATWVGLRLATSITVPIQRLVEGTRRVAQGHLDFEIDGTRDDEIGLLITSFNQMTRDLRHSKMALQEANEGLQRTNSELNRRRSYMETVLENVAAGVIALDNHGRVTTINTSASELLEISRQQSLGHPYRQVFDASYLKPFLVLIRDMQVDKTSSLREQMQVCVKGKILRLLVSLNFLKDSANRYLGCVVVFDDLTALINAQKVAAWREMARELAHEIKNPLTPIQLSMQRLRKRFLEGRADTVLVEECVETVIQQVGSLKALVDEFSRFARLPGINPGLHDLHKIIDEAIALYTGTHQNLHLIATSDARLSPFVFDPEQIMRVLINLLENAVEAMQGEGIIRITTRLCPAKRTMQLEVCDTGPGVPEQYRARILEPYFSTKKHGTGLGLSLARRIIADHRGTLTLLPLQEAGGATFRIELPVG